MVAKTRPCIVLCKATGDPREMCDKPIGVAGFRIPSFLKLQSGNNANYSTCLEKTLYLPLIEIIMFLFQRSKRSFDNFDPEFTQEAARLTPIDRNFIQNIDHRVFDGFSYVNPVLNSVR